MRKLVERIVRVVADVHHRLRQIHRGHGQHTFARFRQCLMGMVPRPVKMRGTCSGNSLPARVSRVLRLVRMNNCPPRCSFRSLMVRDSGDCSMCKSILRGAAELNTRYPDRTGCLGVHGALAGSDDAEPIRRAVVEARANGEGLLRERLERAKRKGGLSPYSAQIGACTYLPQRYVIDSPLRRPIFQDTLSPRTVAASCCPNRSSITDLHGTRLNPTPSSSIA